MKIGWAIFLAACPITFGAQLEWVPEEAPQVVFAGEARKIRVTFSNPTDKTIEVQIRTRLFQASSTTAMPLGQAQPWKKLQVLAGQTIVESASLSFPGVKVGTRFLVQWLDEQGKALGPTEVTVHPPDLLKELKALAGETALGVFDPRDQLKPLLKQWMVDFEDLEQTGWENFSGKLAIVGPLTPQEPASAGLARQIKSAAKAGRAVVWIQLPSRPPTNSEIQAYLIREGDGTVVFARSKTFSELAENPQGQLDLVHLASLVLKPERWESTVLTP
ncbi:MAG TPA: hypothetical protein VEL06_08250 [Haliangiales bacterium]|nr:hypothetical protein [Haliangiales bacterium]